MQSPSTNSFDVMLCGGGVIGLSIAYECAKHGQRVLLVDAKEIGRGSSWAGAGILPAGATTSAHDPLEQLRALSHKLHKEWAQQLLEDTGIDNEYRRCGGLYLAATPGERATLTANNMWWEDHGIEYEAWSNATIANRLPAIKPFVESNPGIQCWFVGQDCRVRNPRHVDALIAGCQKLGVTILDNTSIERFETSTDRIDSAMTKQGHIRADRYCITSGAWASQLLRPLGIETGIMPVRGQMVLYKLDRPLFEMVINEGHRYLVPRDDGHVLAGSCEEEVGFDTTTTESMIEQLHQWATQICPALTRNLIAKTWAGLRPGSFDTYPYLGTLHPFANAFVAAGHFRHGLHWSTATALLMYQWMNGLPTEIDLKPFRVQRGQSIGTNQSTRLQ